MKKVVRLAVWIVVAVVAYNAWVWGQGALRDHRAGRVTDRQQPVMDADKMCQMEADTGQCFCLHRETHRRLDVPYRECVARVREQ